MLQKYLFIPVVAGILGSLAIWSRHIEATVPVVAVSPSGLEKKWAQPRRAMSSLPSSHDPLELEIELLDSN
jgi:hypothetical protein